MPKQSDFAEKYLTSGILATPTPDPLAVAREQNTEIESALENRPEAKKLAAKYGITIRLRKPKRDTYQVAFRRMLGKSWFTLAIWSPTTHLLKIGNQEMRPATILEATRDVIESLEIMGLNCNQNIKKH